MEGTHSKLGARFTDRLGCYSSYSFTYLYKLTLDVEDEQDQTGFISVAY